MLGRFKLYAVAHVKDDMLTHLVSGPYVDRDTADDAREQWESARATFQSRYVVVETDDETVWTS
jgi:hypothetical protein